MHTTPDIIIQSFLDYLKFEKRYSQHTIRGYAEDLSFFRSYLQTVFNESDVAQAPSSYIRSWMADQKEKGLSAKSINRRISTLKSFYKFLIRQGVITLSPMTTITSPKVSKRLPVFIEQKDLHTLFAHVEFPQGWEGRLHRLILALFYSTGMRLSELVQLKDTQVNCELSNLKILGKGNKERIIPMTTELQHLLQEYLTAKMQLEGAEDFLIVTENGKGASPRYVQQIVKNYLSLVTTVEKKSPHILRHSFATHLMNNGADLNAVKELLGHSSLAATQVYTHNTIEKLKDIHKKAHPKG
jgi:integrase/recombinase XerC